MKKIGITTTVPIEILLAAGYQPVDLNNIFVADSNPQLLEDNIRSWNELKEFFSNRLMKEIPVIFALNKRDIIPRIDKSKFQEALQLDGICSLFETVATQGFHTMKILQEILRKILS